MIWRYGESSFDAETGCLRVAGVDTSLDRTGTAILARLIEDLGEPVGKDDLLAAGWPGRIVHENSLAKAIGRLRRALGDDAEAIVAVRCVATLGAAHRIGPDRHCGRGGWRLVCRPGRKG